MEERKKITVRRFVKMKGARKIVMVTAYDYPTARIVDTAGVDSILVGDSLAMVVYGMENTHRVTVDMMARHVEAVARARPRALLVADMPFMSYETSIRDAMLNAAELIRAGAEAVKLEGLYTDVVEELVKAGIPVMGHIGLTPQRYLQLGGYRRQGRARGEAERIVREAEELVEAGVFAIVIEYTSSDVAKRITERVPVPTICIGSGPHCDGQVLVLHDLLGLSDATPPFAKKYVDLTHVIGEAVKRYAGEVRMGVFPGEEHYF